MQTVKVGMPDAANMPVSPRNMQRCTMYLAIRKSTGKAATLMRVENEVLVFEDGCSVTFISPEQGRFDSGWIEDYYTILREYNSGDTLTIAV